MLQNNQLVCYRPPISQPNLQFANADCPTGYSKDPGGTSCTEIDIWKDNPNVRNADCPAGYTYTNTPETTTINSSGQKVTTAAVQACIRPAVTYYNDTTTAATSSTDAGSTWSVSYSPYTLSCPSGSFSALGKPYTIAANEFGRSQGSNGYISCTPLTQNATNFVMDFTQQVSGMRQSTLSIPLNGQYFFNSQANPYANWNGTQQRFVQPCATGFSYNASNNTCTRPQDSKLFSSGPLSCKTTESLINYKCYSPCTDVGYTLDLPTGKCRKPPIVLTSDSMVCNNTAFPYHSGAFCYNTCTGGYRNDGTSCTLDASTLDSSVMTCKTGEFKLGSLCYQNCPTGYTNAGDGTCVRAADSQTADVMTCKDGEFKFGNYCYQNCPTGYSPLGGTCHRVQSDAGPITCTSNC
jgi:hypothetical protein